MVALLTLNNTFKCLLLDLSNLIWTKYPQWKMRILTFLLLSTSQLFRNYITMCLNNIVWYWFLFFCPISPFKQVTGSEFYHLRMGRKTELACTIFLGFCFHKPKLIAGAQDFREGSMVTWRSRSWEKPSPSEIPWGLAGGESYVGPKHCSMEEPREGSKPQKRQQCQIPGKGRTLAQDFQPQLRLPCFMGPQKGRDLLHWEQSFVESLCYLEGPSSLWSFGNWDPGRAEKPQECLRLYFPSSRLYGGGGRRLGTFLRGRN